MKAVIYVVMVSWDKNNPWHPYSAGVKGELVASAYHTKKAAMDQVRALARTYGLRHKPKDSPGPGLYVQQYGPYK